MPAGTLDLRAIVGVFVSQKRKPRQEWETCPVTELQTEIDS